MLRKDLRISNVVCTANLNQKVDLNEFHNFAWGIYDLEIYGGRCGYVKLPNMKGKVIIFPSGKMISVGGNSIEKSIQQLNIAKFHLVQTKLILDVKLEPLVRNIVSSGDLGRKIKLETLVRILPRSIYEPTQFTGLIYRIFESIVALIFASGKVVIAGAKTIRELNNAFFDLRQRIEV